MFDVAIAAKFPIHVVWRCPGNSPNIGRKHYLRVRESDFAVSAGRS
jgi:hypothetical protein